MIRVEIHRGKAVPPGTPFREWRNVSGYSLLLQPPGLPPINLGPAGRVQVPCADLGTVPELEAWFEECELAGTLRASAQ